MKTHLGSLALFIGFSAAALVPIKAKETNTNGVRIGIYDSRSVAVAYVGSPKSEAKMAAVRQEHRKAKLDNNTAALAEIDARMQNLQTLRHAQGFSTAPVDDILGEFAAETAAIQTSNNLTAIVSKWDTASLLRYKTAEHIDITLQLIDALQPSAKQRRFAIDIQKKEPISLQKAGSIKE